MNKKAIFAVCLLLCCGTATLQAQYQLPNSGFESWDTTSYSLPIGWNSYHTANCNIQGLPANYAATIAKIINSTVVHSRTQGSRPGGKGGNYLTLQSRNVNASGINMTVSGIVCTGRFNIGSISVYTPLNYFSTERKLPAFRMPLASTPDSMYLWVRYYAVDDDSSRARIVAYIHGDTDFQYMNHAGNKALYCGYIHHLMSRTDSVLPATRWVQLRLPFVYDGKAKPKYLLMYMASDSCIMGGKIGNELSVDDIELVYSSWLKGIMVDSVPVPDFKKDVFSYMVELPCGTPSGYVPKVQVTGEVADQYDSILFVPSAKGVDGGKTVIRVFAEDGVSTHTYTLTYSIAKSTDARLSALLYDRTPVPGFNPDTLHYEVVLAPGTTVPPVLSCTTSFPGLKPQITQAVSLPGSAMVVVTAEDGRTQLRYTVDFKVALSKDASASWIRYNQQPLSGFHPDTLWYSAELPLGTTSVQLTAAATWPKATVRYRQAGKLPGTGEVTVVAEDTNFRRTYRVYFTVTKSSNARLDSLYYLLGGQRYALSGFRPDLTDYTVMLPEKSKLRPVVKAVAQDTGAKIRISYPALISDTVKVWVVAENGRDSLCYRILFQVRKSQNARLAGLKVNGKPLAGFKDTVYDYPVLLDSAVVPFVEALPADSDAQVRILFPAGVPGTVQVYVRAEDTSVQCVYRLHCSIRLSDNADLMSLGYKLGQTYFPVSNFHKDTLHYRVMLPPFTATAPVLMWVKADFDAAETYRQPSTPRDTAFVEVRSVSGLQRKRYEVVFGVEISREARLDSLYCDGVPLAVFNPDTVFYTVRLHPDSVRVPQVTVRTKSIGAVARVRQASALGDTAVVEVKAQDSSVVMHYYVHFIRKPSSVSSLASFHYSLAGADSSVQLLPGVSEYLVRLREKSLGYPVNLKCVPEDSRASVKFIRVPVSINDTALIRVLAEDGTSVTVYRFVFFRVPSPDADLDSIWVNGVPLHNFQPDRMQYSYGLPLDVQEPPVVTAKASWEIASVYVTQASEVFGTAQIRVVAEDGVHYKVYAISFRTIRQESRLKAVYLDGGYPVPQFRPDVYAYAFPYGPDWPKELTAETLDPFATYRWGSDIHSDTMEIRIYTFAEDTTVQSFYTVRVFRPNAVPDYAAETIMLYPNPANTLLHVSGVKGESVRVYDLSGRILMQVEAGGDETLQLDVSGLSGGMYLLRCGQRVASFVVARD